MGKLLNFFDNYILKIGISFLLVFVALYPKLPSVHVNYTWVYIRLEDFFIALVVILWAIQLIRRKVSLPFKLGSPIAAYWIAGLVSLLVSFVFIAPNLVNFYPQIAILSYLRRIEYMLLFFVAFSTIRSVKDLRDYFVILCLTLVGVIFYGLGQRFYILFWQIIAPLHLTKYFFCFPSFQTGNEEFAKGIPLCLSADARVTSTFAGSYDLSAYLVVAIPILIALIFYVKRRFAKIGLSFLTLFSIILLILTASRISFVAYIISGSAVLVFLKKKIFIPVFLIVSIVVLLAFSQSTAKRFMQTFGLASVVIDSQGHVVGEQLPADLQAKLANDKLILANQPTSNLPRGTGFLGLPQTKNQKTNVAVVTSGLSKDEARRLKLENGGVQLSTVSGNFSVKKVLVYDISFTTRFQAEWPNAIKAFTLSPLVGSGFATITLATDNDYLRLLGETGIIGFIAFFLIFIVFYIAGLDLFPNIKSRFVKTFLIGLFAGILGLLINASLIDVFESSKVAETLWILLGIGLGGAFLFKKEEINYKKYFLRIIGSNYFLFPLIFILFLVVFLPSIGNFFVGDDFTWLKWAATSTIYNIPGYFTQAQGFFYRPIDKTVIFFLYTLFSFNPGGYHLFLLLIHFLTGVGVYLLGRKVLPKRSLAFLAMLVFLFLPSQAENLFWFSTISVTLSTFLMIFGILSFIKFRQNSSFSLIFYILSLVLGTLALLTYEMSVVYVLLIFLCDLFISKTKLSLRSLAWYIPLFLLDPAYLFIRNAAHSFQASGDYSYNALHFLPNMVGNLIGYVGLFIFGEKFLTLYTITRDSLKEESLFVFAFLFIAVIILSGIIFLTRKRLSTLYRNQNVKTIVFCGFFIFISLLPFMGLGNITQRYGYLASVGFALALSLVIGILVIKVTKKVKNPYTYTGLLLICLVLIGGFYYYQLRHENEEWLAAGKITNRTLSYLKIFDEKIKPNSTFYFVNLPIRRENAWVFPVGLNDGIWFIYQDDSLRVEKANSVDDAMLIKEKNPDLVHVFYFDKDFKVSEKK